MTESNPSQERSGSVSKLGTAIGLALDSIRAHKLRSFLTLLGMIIGVASVILVLRLVYGEHHGQGFRQRQFHDFADCQFGALERA